ncbi:MAG: protein translocase subunit SecF [Candidatus Nealsonbacteria bacterium]
MRINFLKYSKFYFVLGGIFVIASIASLIVYGLKPGIDFTGGSILEVAYLDNKISNEEIRQKLAVLNLDSLSIQSAGQDGVIFKMEYIDEETHQSIIEILKENNSIEEKRFESVGSVIGRELRQKTITLIVVSLLAIVLYIAFAFRKVQGPIRSWQYGVVSLLILSHDIIIPLGVFTVLGKFYGIQVTIPIIAAILTILGYSINNTVVVFDRIRENLIRRAGNNFSEIVNNSINQTLTRCLNTSFTTLLPLLAIFFWGGDTLRYFALTLIIGLTAGLCSAILLASPILVIWSTWRKS